MQISHHAGSKYYIFRNLCGLLLLLILVGCDEGAVVFEPTPLPPDLSPARYQHPSGAFTLDVPRQWAVYTQNTTELASAHFTPPGYDEPVVGVGVINVGAEAVLPPISEIMNRYQFEIRPDTRRYREQERQAMGDGSWRLTGVRSTYGRLPQDVNTFFLIEESLIGVLEITMPENDPALLSDLEAIANTFQLNPAAELEPTTILAFSRMARSELQVVNAFSWTAETGVYFITGEVANNGPTPVGAVPLRVALETTDGTEIVEALDTTMGYAILPGEFAPFSLRFGQGRPDETPFFDLRLGNLTGTLPPDAIYGGTVMNWTDDLTISETGDILITGTVTNVSEATVYDPLATVTVFDSSQRVIAAAFTPILEGALEPGIGRDFQIRITEIGGTPSDYIINIQASTSDG